jgi:outer membrane protein TolC
MNELTEKRYQQLKRDVDESRSAAERARGALDATIKTLKEEFKVDNLEQAKEKLAELKQEAATAQKKFDRAFDDYQKKWKGDDNEG